MSRPINEVTSVRQMRLRAKSRLPRAVFDFIDGGADDERSLVRNTVDFASIQFQPRVMRDVSHVNLHRQFFGQTSAMPVVIAPTGLTGVAWPRADSLIASAAKAHKIPHTLAALGSCSIEDIATAGSARRWFQVYVLKNREVTLQLVNRAQQNGFDTLVVTLDVPVIGKREKDSLNGFTVPLKWTPRLCLDMLCHPHWSLATLRHGVPVMKSLLPYTDVDTRTVAAHASWINNAFDPAATWTDLEPLRQAWQGALLVKGIMTCEDADKAIQMGADGIVVSNHGGRQLDGAVSSVVALERIAHHVNGQVPLLLDSGVRRGSDIVKALCLGATAVMIGRATLYGAAAGGEPGAHRVLTLLREEVERTLALLGVSDINALDKSLLDR